MTAGVVAVYTATDGKEYRRGLRWMKRDDMGRGGLLDCKAFHQVKWIECLDERGNNVLLMTRHIVTARYEWREWDSGSGPTVLLPRPPGVSS